MKFLSKSALLALFFCLLYHVGRSQAQPTTDASEASIINSMFQQWGVSAASETWNTSGEICSGTATDSSTVDDQNINPAVKCDCSFINGTICRVTALKVYALDARGAIPNEIGNLTRLTNLILGQNFLSGPLPPSIGNLTRMQYLSLGINALSGPIPKELGNLQDLIMLSISSNRFIGPLPDELGNLRNLQQLYIDSSGAVGQIPSTFANLQSLQIVWASDNHFTGNIPDFIGNWSNLTTLRLQGNDFEGPIPSSFVNLTSLTDLRIGDIYNGTSSSLEFIKDMKSLGVLILRNARISGSIPSGIVEYQFLQHLDLSFNNLTGELPSSLFNLRQLAFLFLGNNSFSGSLPTQKSSSLQTIDLSYNELSGTFPSWVSEDNLELNLVANNFVVANGNSSLPSGLNCLQRSFPCNRVSPRYSSFAVKCGGLSITSSGNIMFETDNDRLGPASYSVASSQKWAVSNTGRFMENKNASYTISSLSQFTNTLDSELFQTARISPGSLRYYGLGLENGNYNLNLEFAEFKIENANSWKSVGRRIFDIYVQGNLVLKDFDIRKEANGSLRAVRKTFLTNVTNSYLDIHLFWAGKGTCCIPDQGTYGPSVSAISVEPNFVPTVDNQETGKKDRTGLVVGLAVGAAFLSFLAVFAIIIWRRSRTGLDEDEEFMGLNYKADTFSYVELRNATNDFNPVNKLGEGGFGPVYKGTLPDGRAVAVKQLSVTSHQGKSQFVTEIATISAVQHRNLVKLYGCCMEGDKRLLVYEYLENKSLDQALFGSSSLKLDWPTRFGICMGTARGLAYLHEESRLRIVHRDVKASNILLDADINAKISDFGLAKLYDDKKTHISTRVAGTFGYLAPEYAMRGHLTEKIDVFAFGVVAVEILSGRPNVDPSLDQQKMYLLEWAWCLHESNRDLELVDPALSEFNKEEALRIITVSLLCTQASPLLRPPMSRVVRMLSGDIEVGAVASKPGYLSDLQFSEITNSFMSSDTSGISTGTVTESQDNISPTVSMVVHTDSSPLAPKSMNTY
ncbi:probable LRR receptor-like serine/threonine-protein kinase At1g56140 [Aristolochia californica]|uniref:probable LRR receptor-like serine/threonine-protein kinase At1g56140 n=1 Tax=Aristolochia californica TaxID=171875 RepID=UPI0035D930A3